MGPILDAVKRSSEHTVDIERYTDAIRFAACVMTSDGPGGAASRAREKG